MSSVKQRIPSKFQSWFGTAKSQNVKVVRKLSYWQSFLHGIWGGQPYMLRENIDNVLNPPVVRHCCVLSICILKPMPMHFSFACSANIEHRVGFLRRKPRCSITTHSHVHDLYSLFASCCHIQLHNYESIIMREQFSWAVPMCMCSHSSSFIFVADC